MYREIPVRSRCGSQAICAFPAAEAWLRGSTANCCCRSSARQGRQDPEIRVLACPGTRRSAARGKKCVCAGRYNVGYAVERPNDETKLKSTKNNPRPTPQAGRFRRRLKLLLCVSSPCVSSSASASCSSSSSATSTAALTQTIRRRRRRATDGFRARRRVGRRRRRRLLQNRASRAEETPPSPPRG